MVAIGYLIEEGNIFFYSTVFPICNDSIYIVMATYCIFGVKVTTCGKDQLDHRHLPRCDKSKSVTVIVLSVGKFPWLDCLYYIDVFQWGYCALYLLSVAQTWAGISG